MRKFTIFTLAAVFLLTGCATMFSGRYNDVVMSSYPSGAKVFHNGIYRGNAPLTLNLAKSDDHTVRFELEGYIPQEIALSKKLNGWVYLDFLWAGISVVDGLNDDSRVQYEADTGESMSKGEWIATSLIMGAVPTAIDYFSGAMYNITPTTVGARFTKKEVNSKTDGGKFFVRVNMAPVQ